MVWNNPLGLTLPAFYVPIQARGALIQMVEGYLSAS